jgi:hypothetical protein
VAESVGFLRGLLSRTEVPSAAGDAR